MARNKNVQPESRICISESKKCTQCWMHRPQAVHIRKNELHEGWEVILRNQFHDILPGSSIKEVYDDSKAEYEGIFAENKH